MTPLDRIPIEIWAATITAVPVIGVATWGHRVGLRRLVRSLLNWLAVWGAGGVVAAAGFCLEWYVPFGLVTPVLLGLVAAVAARLCLGQRRAAEVPTHRRWGAVIGGSVGFTAATLAWFAAALIETAITALPEPTPVVARSVDPTVETPAPPREVSVGDWTRVLVRTTHRGFVRHLPILGEYSDEVEGLVVVLNASRDARAALVERHELHALTEVPAFERILEDDELWTAVDDLAAGDVWALYALQRNRHLIAFVSDPRVRSAIERLRPSQLAREIEALGPSGLGSSGR